MKIARQNSRDRSNFVGSRGFIVSNALLMARIHSYRTNRSLHQIPEQQQVNQECAGTTQNLFVPTFLYWSFTSTLRLDSEQGRREGKMGSRTSASFDDSARKW
jgi:hypothetical protein